MNDRYSSPDAGRLDDVFDVPGKRTTGTGRRHIAITGPGWNGTLPKASRSTSRRPACVDLGRIYCTGTPEDYKAVTRYRTNKRSAAERLWQALHAAGRQSGPVDRHEEAVRDQVNELDADAYFTLLAGVVEDQSTNRSRRADGREAG